MILADVMDEIAQRLDAIPDLRAYGYPPGSIVPPVAIVDFPENITYDATYGRGVDTGSLDVWVVAGRPADRATRDLLSAYADGSGARSVKAAVEAGGVGTSFDDVRVAAVEFDPVEYAGATFLAARFTVEFIGRGA